MDVKHKDLKYLGILDIFKETHKIINKNRKIFSMAAICFVHPLNLILSYIIGTLNLLLKNLLQYGNFSHLFFDNWPLFWSSNVFNIIFLFCYSTVSTAAVAHTVAAVYTGGEPSTKGTTSVIGKVWKRVLVTFLCVLLAFLVYNIIAGFVLFLIIWTTTTKHGPFGEINGSILGVFLVFYFAGLLYLVVVLQLSGVVSVLEDSCGFKAMAKSRLLLKGKMAAATAVVFVNCLSFGIIMWLDVVGKLVISLPMFALVSLLVLLLILVLLLWKLVLDTMLYFVCKSHHRESIDLVAPLDQDRSP